MADQHQKCAEQKNNNAFFEKRTGVRCQKIFYGGFDGWYARANCGQHQRAGQNENEDDIH